jgi:hypothetical protein
MTMVISDDLFSIKKTDYCPTRKLILFTVNFNDLSNLSKESLLPRFEFFLTSLETILNDNQNKKFIVVNTHGLKCKMLQKLFFDKYYSKLLKVKLNEQCQKFILITGSKFLKMSSNMLSKVLKTQNKFCIKNSESEASSVLFNHVMSTNQD